MRLRKMAVTLTAAMLLLCACGQKGHSEASAASEAAPTVQPTAEPSPIEQATPRPEATPQSLSAEETLLQTMTLEEKVGQLFWVRPDALDATQNAEQRDDPYAAGVTELTDALREQLERYPVGGVVLFGKNLTGPEQCRTILRQFEGALDIPLITAVDEEGGLVTRLAGKKAFAGEGLPVYESMGAVPDEAAAREVGRSIGAYLKDYGFTLDFAPVADVNTNPDNPIIGTRAFDPDPQQAARQVAAAVEGFHESGMLCCLKHFPGHGDTAEDSHLGYATSGKTWEEIQACELLPFASGIAAGADCVMAAHITVPNAEGGELPASLSHTMLTERLRGELGFDGVIVTDSLAMGAITESFSSGEAAVLALQAGADVLLMPRELDEAFAAVVAAVQSGEVSEERLDESVLRLLKLKTAAGLL